MITSDDVAAVAPPLCPGAPVPGETIHPLACFHRKWRVDDGRATAARSAAYDALEAVLPKKHRRLLLDLDANYGWATVDAEDTFVEHLARHFPGLAPAIRAIAYHHEDDRDEPHCCERWMGKERPGLGAKHNAVRFVHHYISQLAHLDAELETTLKRLDPDEYREVFGLLSDLTAQLDEAWPGDGSVPTLDQIRAVDIHDA